MANPHPHGYPVPASALHLTTSDGARFAILFRQDHYPTVLAPINVYNVERIYTRDTEQHVIQPQQVTYIDPSDQRLGGDLRINVNHLCAIDLTWAALEIVWPATVIICGVPNVRAVTFVFENAPQRYGSYLLSWARGR
jgi:hypothetical protein